MMWMYQKDETLRLRYPDGQIRVVVSGQELDRLDHPRLKSCFRCGDIIQVITMPRKVVTRSEKKAVITKTSEVRSRSKKERRGNGSTT